MRQEAAQRGADLDRERFGGLDPVNVQAERAVLWEERLLALTRETKIDLATLPPKKSHSAKVLLAAALKQSSSSPNGWISQRLQMGPPASARQFALRWWLSPVSRNLRKSFCRESKYDVFYRIHQKTACAGAQLVAFIGELIGALLKTLCDNCSCESLGAADLLFLQ